MAYACAKRIRWMVKKSVALKVPDAEARERTL